MGQAEDWAELCSEGRQRTGKGIFLLKAWVMEQSQERLGSKCTS